MSLSHNPAELKQQLLATIDDMRFEIQGQRHRIQELMQREQQLHYDGNALKQDRDAYREVLKFLLSGIPMQPRTMEMIVASVHTNMKTDLSASVLMSMIAVEREMYERSADMRSQLDKAGL